MSCRSLLLIMLVGLPGLVPAPVTAASPFGAFMRSLVIPGWAQANNGHRTAAIRFAVVEGLLWGGYFGMSAVANVRQDNYRTYAIEHASATPQGKAGVYFDDLGFYLSQQQHDLFALVDDGPQAVLYGSTPGNTWEWDLDASRQRYRDLRNAAERADRKALFATGVILVNHLVAAIHAGRTAADPWTARSVSTWSLQPLVAANGGSGLNFVRRF